MRTRNINYLKAVFWDYPQFAEEKYLNQALEKARGQGDREAYFWLMRKFLENARVVDTLRFFSIDEIAEHMQNLHLSLYNRKKWQRLIEVYRAS